MRASAYRHRGWGLASPRGDASVCVTSRILDLSVAASIHVGTCAVGRDLRQLSARVRAAAAGVYANSAASAVTTLRQQRYRGQPGERTAALDPAKVVRQACSSPGGDCARRTCCSGIPAFVHAPPWLRNGTSWGCHCSVPACPMAIEPRQGLSLIK